jgi:CubicO group peptidase (beta-lactamase class C family)
MRELVRDELAEPLDIDGLYLGRPPAAAPTRVAQVITPQSTFANPVFNRIAAKVAASELSRGFGAVYFPGIKTAVQGDVPLLDAEMPSSNGVGTARGLARMYAAIANGGQIDGIQFLSRELVAGLSGPRSLRPDHNILLPQAFHLGYHRVPFPGVMPGFGHVGLGGSLGWADPATGMAFAFVHNRLLTPFVAVDQGAFIALDALIRWGVARVRKRGFKAVTGFGAPFTEPGAAAG